MFIFESDSQYILRFLEKENINVLVVHGLKDSTHSHHFIHEAIYKTFLYIKSIYRNKLNVIWCNDDESSVNNYNNLNNYFIFSSPHYNTDNYLPVLKNAFYILHYRTHDYINKKPIVKYNDLIKEKRVIKYIEFRGEPREEKKDNITYIDNLFWYYFNYNSNFPTSELHIPWATDLLPYEIDKNITLMIDQKFYKKESYFCGSVWKTNEKEVNEWKILCMKSKINCCFDREKDPNVYEKKIRESLFAPAFQGATQHYSEKNFYIPCRIFKNISYGALPITNNKGVYNIFKDYLVIYDNDLDELFNKVLMYRHDETENKIKHIEKMIDIMNYVKENHTFINRLKLLISFGFM